MLRVKVLEEWQRMLIEINGEINYSAQSMSQICRQMSKTSVYGKKFWDGIAKKTEERNAGLPGEFWREHLREYRYIELLSNEDREIICQFGESFGTLDICSQINEIELFEKDLKKICLMPDKKWLNRKKYVLLWVLFQG